MSKYTVFFEPTATGYSAHVPDLPGCVTPGQTLDDARRLIAEAIEFHIKGLRLLGAHVPEPSTVGEQVEVQATSL